MNLAAAFISGFGSYDHGSVGCGTSIERSCGRPFHYVDGFDVIGVQVYYAVRAHVGLPFAAGLSSVRVHDRNAVDHEQRIRAAAHRLDSPEDYPGRSAYLGGSRNVSS